MKAELGFAQRRPMATAAIAGSRLLSVDALRGTVMVLMALDHVRDFFHSAATSFSPTDLTKTSAVLFLTRWVTHFCLPMFVFTSGMGACFWWQRGNRTKGQLSRFLWTRGLWLIALELTVMQFAYDFNFSSTVMILLLVLWIFGACMIAMALLIYLPLRTLAALSIAVLVLHNCLDPIPAARFGAFQWAWNLLHQPGVFIAGGRPVLVSYTLVPWIAVMASGFCFGRVFTLDAASRQRISLGLGVALTAAFIVIRAVNRYGDPAPWSVQGSPVFTVLSFLNCTKYPASLDFLLMTLGPALMLLAFLDRRTLGASNPLVVFGRVPLFYFVLHFYAIHILVVLASLIRYGPVAWTFVFNPLPSMGGPQQLFPTGFGYRLWVVYAVWIVIVASLYPLCKWFANIKARPNAWWLSYL
jgi:uncharacterized membrane protein